MEWVAAFSGLRSLAAYAFELPSRWAASLVSSQARAKRISERTVALDSPSVSAIFEGQAGEHP